MKPPTFEDLETTASGVYSPSIAPTSPPNMLTPEEMASIAIDQQEYLEAASYLDQISASSPLPKVLVEQAAHVYQQAATVTEGHENSLAAHYYYKGAQYLLAENAPEKALSLLKKSLALRDNDEVRELYLYQQHELWDKYHRLAAIAYRKQELDNAIQLWQKALDIDPENNTVKAYLIQAQELKRKLADIKKK